MSEKNLYYSLRETSMQLKNKKCYNLNIRDWVEIYSNKKENTKWSLYTYLQGARANKNIRF